MVTKKWVQETGIVLAILLLVPSFSSTSYWLIASACVLLVSLLVPTALYPLGWLWYKFAVLLRVVMSTLLFTIMFCVVVIPMGMARRFFSSSSIESWSFRKRTDDSTTLRELSRSASEETLTNPY